MSRGITQLLASLVLDDWPLPVRLRRWIRAIPAVNEAIGQHRSLENRLRPSVRTPNSVASKLGERPVEYPSQRAKRLVGLSFVSAACLLVAAGIWMRGSSRDLVAQSKSSFADLRPVLASISAGQQVASSVSSGVRDVTSSLVTATQRLGRQFNVWKSDALVTEHDADTSMDPD